MNIHRELITLWSLVESFNFFPPKPVLICKMGTQCLSDVKTVLTSGLLRQHTSPSGLGEPWVTSFHRDSDPGTSMRSEPREGEA